MVMRLFILLLTLTATCQAVPQNAVDVRYTLLDKTAFENAIVGNTVVGSTPFGKNLYMIYFAPDNTCELAAKGNIYVGTWSTDVTSDGTPCVRAFWPEYTSTNSKSLFNPENPKFGSSTSVIYYQSQEYPQALLLVTKTSKYGAIVVPGKQGLDR